MRDLQRGAEGGGLGSQRNLLLLKRVKGDKANCFLGGGLIVKQGTVTGIYCWSCNL